MTELEMLAVIWAANKCKTFLIGIITDFQVITDHNPLVLMLNSHHLDEIDNPRTLKTKLMAFNLTAKSSKGATNRVLCRFSIPISTLEVTAGKYSC